MKFSTSAILIASLAGLLTGVSTIQAQAADIAAPSTYNWSGLFGGGYLGYNFGTSHIFDNQVTSGFTDFDSSFNLNGLEAGIQAEWNQQNGKFVWGAALDAGYNGASSGTPWPFGTSSTVRTDFEGSLRVRAGLAQDNFLIYATGGLAGANIVANYYDTGNRHDVISGLAPGYTVGVGAEFATQSDWVIGAEVRYTNYSGVKGVTTTTDPSWYETNQVHETTARLSFSKHF